MKKLTWLIVISMGFGGALWAQEDEESVNIQAYTPSVLLRPGQWEFKHFNNLYTQTKFFSGTERVSAGQRQSFLTSINQFFIGVHPKFNLGLEVWLNSTRYDSENSSAFKTYTFADNPNHRTALSYLGPKIKFAPFRNFERFSIQSTFLFPIANNLTGNEEKPGIFVADDRYLWINQFFVDWNLGEKFQVFAQVSTWLSLDRYPSDASNFRRFDLPLTAFLSYFPSPRWTIYLQQEFWNRFNQNDTFSYFYQPGLGLKFQAVPGLLELEGSYTNFLLGKNEGAGQTFNVGIRLIRQ
ncbi:MAG: hypothetical protein HC913_02455 [Microscillaceae bacterium]|nr:hypothetical protein [Microscillaceae bacterium]